MSHSHLVILSALVAFAGFVQGSTGLGFAMILSPFLGLLEPKLLPVGVLALMLPLNFYVAWRERLAIDVRGASWISAGRIVGTAGGLWVLVALSASALGIFVGVSILAAVAATLVMPKFAPTRHAFLAAGLVTGVTETATGVGGPPLALVYQHEAVPTMRATIAVCFLVGEVVSLIVLFASGKAGMAQVTGVGLLLPALVVGAVASRYVHQRINARFMRAFVMVFASASALVLLARSFG